MTDITCRAIVMKGNEFYRGQYVFPNGKTIFYFSPNRHDAKAFKTLEKAHEKAKQIGGYVRMLDALNSELI